MRKQINECFYQKQAIKQLYQTKFKQMRNRLTVQQIYKIQQPQKIQLKLTIKNALFTDHYIYLIDQSQYQLLKKISYKNFQTQDSIQLPQIVYNNYINSLQQIDNIILFSLKGKSQLFFINSHKQTFSLKSHLKPINQLLRYQNVITSCSDDFTIRVWSKQRQNILQSHVKHILHGHTDKVISLQICHDLLASCSKDNSIIFWKNGQIHCKYKSSFAIKNMLQCYESNQFLVFTEQGQISILNLQSIVKNKKPQLLRTINYLDQSTLLKEKCFVSCFQIDDSFVIFLDNESIAFVEINLGQIIRKEKIANKDSNIIGVKCFGRMLIFAKFMEGLQLLKF